jgi:hypothetical protein
MQPIRSRSRSKVELRVDHNFQITEYYQKHPSLKKTE